MAAGRSRTLWIGALVVVALGASLRGGPAAGEDKRAADAAEKLRAAAGGRAGEASRLAAFDDLRKQDTGEARAALEVLADSKDTAVALRALATLGRADQVGGRAKLKKVFEDDRRPDVDRAVAFIAYARLAAKDGASWESLESYAKEHCKKDSALAGDVADAKAALFPEKGGK